MNRRSFLKMLFGGAAAAIAVPVLPKFVPAGSSIIVDLPGPLEYAHVPYMFCANFDLDLDLKKIVLQLDSLFVMHQLGIWFNPECRYAALSQFFNEVYLDVKISDQTYLEGPAYMLAQGSGFGKGQEVMDRLAVPLLVEKELTLDFKSVESWKPPSGIKGQIILQGLKEIPVAFGYKWPPLFDAEFYLD